MGAAARSPSLRPAWSRSESSLEFGQLYSPGRSFELGDMAADAVGVIAGAFLGLLVGLRPGTL